MTPPSVALYGRSSSHYTRLARIFAIEAAVEVSFIVVHDLRSLDPRVYGGHPALKTPLLLMGGDAVFGAENICRRLAVSAPRGLSVTWPEHLKWAELHNAQELVWQAMQTQVQLVFGLEIAGLPADNLYFAKAREGLCATLDWLDARLPRLLRRFPRRDISLLEASLFCLFEHLRFRGGVDPADRANLRAFAEAFRLRPSAQATAYAFDAP